MTYALRQLVGLGGHGGKAITWKSGEVSGGIKWREEQGDGEVSQKRADWTASGRSFALHGHPEPSLVRHFLFDLYTCLISFRLHLSVHEHRTASLAETSSWIISVHEVASVLAVNRNLSSISYSPLSHPKPRQSPRNVPHTLLRLDLSSLLLTLFLLRCSSTDLLPTIRRS